MPTLHRRAFASLALMPPLLPLVACAQAPSMEGWPKPQNGQPSVTYLRLLRKTPFFVGLGDEQLQWAIDHSREWRVKAGDEITGSALGPDNFWVLLDGGWQVEQGATVRPAGHADPAKWYGGAELQALKLQPTRLVATAPSYVMHIRWADLQQMRQQRGFGPVFDPQLREGLAFYKANFR